MRLSPLSLRARLFVLALAILLPALATGGLAMATAYGRETAALEQTLKETTRALSLVIDRELALREALAWSLSDAPSLSLPDLAAFDVQARSATRTSGGWVVVTEHPLTGQAPWQIVNTSVPPGRPLPGGQRLSQFDGWSDRSAAVSDLFKGPVSGDWVVAVSVPSQRMRDASRLAVSVAMKSDALQRLLEEQRLPPDWTAAVIDRGGHIVARQPNSGQWRGQLATEDVRRRIVAGEDGLFQSRTLDGRSTTAHLSRSPSYGWTFIIGVPDAVRVASLRQSLRDVALAAAALVALAGLLAYFAGRRIADHVTRLAETARLLEAGHRGAYRETGVAELDAIGRTLVSASARIHGASELLERKVDAAVAEAKQVQARLALSQRLEALGRLTGGVAHDVNNLLGVITNSVFVLQRLDDAGRGSVQMHAIRRAVETGRQLTQKLLAFAGRRTVSPEAMSLHVWLPGAISLLRSLLRPGIDVAIDIAEDTPAVTVDAAELELALLNVFVNASDAMPGGGRVRVAAGRVGADVSPLGVEAVLIEVSDSGEGIPPELIDRVFEPFFTTKDVTRGSGLGLSQVYGCFTAHGGTARIRSVAGQGTTVSMFLPVSAAPTAVVAPASASAAAPAPSPVSAPVSAPPPAPAPAADSIRVLYVEDNDALAASTVLALASFGFTVERVEDAAAAQRSLALRSCRIVLTDIVMPGPLSGLDLALALRASHPGLPVLLMTGYSGQSSAALKEGFEVLNKPCLPDALHDALLRHLAAAQYPR